jgi:hypothetical protein
MDAYKAVIGKPEVKSPLGRSRCNWEDNVKMDLREIGLGSAVISYDSG